MDFSTMTHEARPLMPLPQPPHEAHPLVPLFRLFEHMTCSCLPLACFGGAGIFTPLPRLHQKSKAVLLIRHGQAQHNPRRDPRWIARTVAFRDSSLTPVGVEQAEEARERLTSNGWVQHLEAVFVSPLSRAVHTAHLIFGDAPFPPRLLSPLLTERAWWLCDRGTPKEELAARHPFVVKAPWVGMEQLERIWWPQQIEREEQLAVRTNAFKASLLARKERVVAVVGHGAFFRTLIDGVTHLPNAQPRWAELSADGTLTLRPEWDACNSWAELERVAGMETTKGDEASRELL